MGQDSGRRFSTQKSGNTDTVLNEKRCSNQVNLLRSRYGFGVLQRSIAWSSSLGYRTFRCSKAIVDSTGIGDVVAEQFEASGMEVEPFVFTQPSRRLLIEELVLSLDNREIQIPATEKFEVYRRELESFEYVLDGSTVRYSVPGSMNDDSVISLALAVHGWHSSRGALLGLVALLKNRAKQIAEGVRDTFGELVNRPAPKPIVIRKPVEALKVEARSEGFLEWQRTGRAPVCKACGNSSTRFNELRQVFCNQCHAVDGVVPVRVGADGLCPKCGLVMRSVSGSWYCQNDGQLVQPDARYPVNGAKWSDVPRGRAFNGQFGRFG
jgi:hypothetical protein